VLPNKQKQTKKTQKENSLIECIFVHAQPLNANNVGKTIVAQHQRGGIGDPTY